MTQVFIGLGANLGDPPVRFRVALKRMHALDGVQVSACSSLYRSRPMGPQDQPDYANAVARLTCSLTPLELLDALQAVEKELGRVRGAEVRWGEPRVLDLDILLFGNLRWRHPRLTLPHPGVTVREFVVFPLLELAPELRLPDGAGLAHEARNLDRNGMKLWSDEKLW